MATAIRDLPDNPDQLFQSLRMRIALFTDADVFAGTERHMLDLAGGLRDLGLVPLLACPSPSPLAFRAAQQGIGVIPIAKRGAVDWCAVRKLARLLNVNRIDVIHAHNGRTALSAALAVMLAGRGCFVATQHFLHPARATRTGLKATVSSHLHRWVGRRAGGLIAVSQAARREMAARGDASHQRITVIPNGIPEPRLSDSPGKTEARRSIGIGPDVPLVLCAARLEPEKDIVSLVRAMGEVIKQNPDALCLVAGEGSNRSRIENEIARLGLSDRVRLLGFCSEMEGFFAACDLLVLPSLAEPFGLVLLEAMSHGRAVVATRAGGPPEIVADGETGLLVTPADPAALASAILKLVNDAGLCEKMGIRGRQRVHERFTVAAMARATARVYESAMCQ